LGYTQLLDAALTLPLTPPRTLTGSLTRSRFRVQGAVQGVGFRPWCAQQAAELALAGWVRNDAQGLICELQGAPEAVHAFARRLREQAPPLARVERIEQLALPVWAPWPSGADGTGEAGRARFHILPSETDAATALATSLPPDTAPCADCLAELFDPANRRWRHPFITCTQCGPRFSITARLPYDRPNTSLADFPLCPACAAEYHTPGNRRHHAQPIGCPACGPRIALWRPDGTPLPAITTPEVLADAVARLNAGQVLAVKGVGGYHLMADARQPATLARLRAAKQRAHKPFALMLPTLASARQWVQLSATEEMGEMGEPEEQARQDAADAANGLPGESFTGYTQKLLTDPRRPIVLLPCLPGVAQAHPLIAPGLEEWGVMLPPSPLHLLLCHEALGRPSGTDWLNAPHAPLWVLTSANPGGEPLVTQEEEAVARLGGAAGLADALLVHDRPILSRLDDSVRRPLGRDAQGRPHTVWIRRARGWVPEPVPLPGVSADAPPVLALGGWLKNTVCVTRGNEAFVSPHLGDLGNAPSRRALVEMVERLCGFLGVKPALIAHDLHPDFFSTQHAHALAQTWGVPTLPVQHHHAHAAAVLAEHGGHADALALVLDGTGLGTDGTPWGGELLHLRADAPATSPAAWLAQFTRLGHLPTLRLAGGDQAAAQPWRLGAAVLMAAGQGERIAERYVAQPQAALVATLLARGLNSPPTSSAGRLFDAAASLLADVQHHSHEAHAATVLEALAQRCPPEQATPWAGAWHLCAEGVLSWPGLWQHLAEAGEPSPEREAHHPARAAQAAAQFHATLVAALAAWVQHHTRAQGVTRVALGGVCFVNRLLRNGLHASLSAAGLDVLEARHLPPGDGGLSFGQAAVALASLVES